MRNSSNKIEFGDFQTPIELANQITSLLSAKGLKPSSILEPTCGIGNIFKSALFSFNDWEKAVGIDINQNHITALEDYKDKEEKFRGKDVQILKQDFFTIDWKEYLTNLPEPILIIGNLPWVTSSGQGVIGGQNLPTKSNFLKFNGFDAISGKSNFDISEWMLIRLLEAMDKRKVVLAMLCKTIVARKILLYAWRNNIVLKDAKIYNFNALKYFNASVDACLFICETSGDKENYNCNVFSELTDLEPVKMIGFHDGQLISNVNSYEKWKHLMGGINNYKWRTGIKHDCSKVMELTKKGDCYINGFGKEIVLEDTYIYPFLKSSDVANGNCSSIDRYVIITQKRVGEDTSSIESKAPKTWAYLCEHGSYLEKRKSSIYRNKPKFSIFAVGDYSFSPWKVAISGLYKKLHFSVVGNIDGKPILLDDTCNFIPCNDIEEAEMLAKLLNSKVAKEFFESFIFWDSKRVITVDLLKKLNISLLAKELNEPLKAEAYLPLAS